MRFDFYLRIMKAFSLIALLTLIFVFDSCDPVDSVKKEELPPATQEGKNTFGCLVNGKLWLPKGRVGSTSNLDASYDPSYKGGSLHFAAYRVDGNNTQDILIGAYNIADEGLFQFNFTGNATAFFYDEASSCSYNDPGDYLTGSLKITKVDLSARVVSGEFDFIVAKINCDTVKVSLGRFDLKF